MYTPIEQFSNLSLRSPMTYQPELHSFGDRKRDVQDILSSFSTEILPTEFRPDLFRSINESQGQSELTISGDLEGSLMQWGTHDERAYRFLNRIQPEERRSILFHQKVARRLDAESRSYTEIDRSSSATYIRDQVREISNSLWMIVEASTQRQKVEGSPSRVGLFIEALSNVCENSRDISGSGRKTRRSSGSQTEASLFHMLIAEPELGQDRFMLDLLDWLADQFVDVLMPHKTSLENIGLRLATLKAPTDYQQRFQDILRKIVGPAGIEETSSADPPSPPPPPPGPTGRKRPARDASGRKAGKRGKGT